MGLKIKINGLQLKIGDKLNLLADVRTVPP